MGRHALAIAGVDHVGVAVAAPAHPLLALLGSEAPAGTGMPSGVRVGRVGPEGRLELVWPERDDSPVSAFLRRRGPGLHHLAFKVVEPLDGVAARLEALGLRSIGSVEPSADGRPSLFLHPAGCGGVLVELVEVAG